MTRVVALALLSTLLAGCATITDALAPPYVPKPIRVYDASQFAADLGECKIAGDAWAPTFSIGSAISKTVDGAASNTSLIPINPLVLPFGAAGGAASAASDGIDFASGQHAAVFKNCLHDETQIDHSAVVADPNNR